MDRVIDLDEAAAAVTDRLPVRRAAGLTCAPLTWRDWASSWPHQLHTDRSEVADPNSLGIHLRGPHDPELLLILFRGGWADIDYVASPDDWGVLPTPSMTSAGDFSSLLDDCVTRAFGLSGLLP